MCLRRAVCAVMVAMAMTVISASPATAESTTQKTIVITGKQSTLTVTFDEPIDKTEAARIEQSLHTGLDEIKKPTIVDPGETYEVIYCSKGTHVYRDSNGQTDIRYNCLHNNVNWGYRIADHLRVIAVSPVTESGAQWYVFDKWCGRNSPHTESATYLFHGTFGGITNGDKVSWHDTLTFRVNAGGKPGVANLSTGGTFVVANR